MGAAPMLDLGTPARTNRAFWIGLCVVMLWAIGSRLVLDAHSYFDAEDALSYSLGVQARSFSHFDAAGSGWQLLCVVVDALLPDSAEATAAGKLVARVSGTLLLLILYITLAHVTRRIALSVWTTILFAGSFCPWWYSLQPDKYVPQLAVLAAVLALVVTRVRPLTTRFLVTLGGLCFLATVVHTDSGLIFLSILPLLDRTRRASGLRVALGQGLIFSFVLFSLLGLYFTSFLLLSVKPNGMAEGLRWSASYLGQVEKPDAWGNWRASSPVLALVGLGRSIFTVEFAFAKPAVTQLVAQKFPAKVLVEEVWFASRLPPHLASAGFALLVSAVSALGVCVVSAAIGLRQAWTQDRGTRRHAVASVACWLIPAVAFFTWWEPTNNEFWIAPWYGGVLLIGIGSASSRWKHAVTAVAASAVILTIHNGLLGILPRLEAQSDYWLVRQESIARLAQANDLVVEYGYMPPYYLELLSTARVFDVNRHGVLAREMLLSLGEELDARPETRSVFVTDMVMNSTSGLSGFSPARDAVVGEFSRSLPPPAEWFAVEGGKLARFEAAALRGTLSKAAAEPSTSGGD